MCKGGGVAIFYLHEKWSDSKKRQVESKFEVWATSDLILQGFATFLQEYFGQLEGERGEQLEAVELRRRHPRSGDWAALPVPGEEKAKAKATMGKAEATMGKAEGKAEATIVITMGKAEATIDGKAEATNDDDMDFN